MKAFNNPFSKSGSASHTINRGATGSQGTFTMPTNTNTRSASAKSPAPLRSNMRCASCR